MTNGSTILLAFDAEPVLPMARPADHLPEARKMVGPADVWDGVDYIPPDD